MTDITNNSLRIITYIMLILGMVRYDFLPINADLYF